MSNFYTANPADYSPREKLPRDPEDGSEFDAYTVQELVREAHAQAKLLCGTEDQRISELLEALACELGSRIPSA